MLNPAKRKGTNPFTLWKEYWFCFPFLDQPSGILLVTLECRASSSLTLRPESRWAPPVTAFFPQFILSTLNSCPFADVAHGYRCHSRVMSYLLSLHLCTSFLFSVVLTSRQWVSFALRSPFGNSISNTALEGYPTLFIALALNKGKGLQRNMRNF